MADWEVDDDEDFDPSYGIGELEAPPVEFPESVGECIDKLYILRSQRIMLAREVKERKRTEAAYTLHIIGRLKDSKQTGGSGETANSSIKSVEEPTPESWPDIYKYITENQAFDMLQRRLSGKAIKERWDQNEDVPGIGKFTKVKLSLTKR